MMFRGGQTCLFALFSKPDICYIRCCVQKADNNMKHLLAMILVLSGITWQANAQSIHNNKSLGHMFSGKSDSKIDIALPDGNIDTFKLSDRNGDGLLASGEYHAYLMYSYSGLMGRHADRISWERVQEIADSNIARGDVPALEKRGELRLTFNMMDRDGDNHIDLSELERASFMLFDQLDQDNNSGIDVDEFADAPGRLILPLAMDLETAERIYDNP